MVRRGIQKRSRTVLLMPLTVRYPRYYVHNVQRTVLPHTGITGGGRLLCTAYCVIQAGVCTCRLIHWRACSCSMRNNIATFATLCVVLFYLNTVSLMPPYAGVLLACPTNNQATRSSTPIPPRSRGTARYAEACTACRGPPHADDRLPTCRAPPSCPASERHRAVGMLRPVPQAGALHGLMTACLHVEPLPLALLLKGAARYRMLRPWPPTYMRGSAARMPP
jgi:hypothetical protein